MTCASTSCNQRKQRTPDLRNPCSWQGLQHLASTDNAAKVFLTQQHAQGPRLYRGLTLWKLNVTLKGLLLKLLGAPHCKTSMSLDRRSITKLIRIAASCRDARAGQW